MLGLPAKHAGLQPYDPLWPHLYAEEAVRIAAALGDWALAIEHIGSTAVPGLAAKPIIDIGVAVRNFEEATRCINPLAALGYLYLGEQGIPRRHYFVKGSTENRTHHLHMVEPDSVDWRQHLAFRDYLRKHPTVAQEYAALKERLAAQFPTDRRLYTQAKAGLIAKVLRQALPESWPQVGDRVTVRVFKSDQSLHRSWATTVERVDDEQIVTMSPPGKIVQDLSKGDWITRSAIRAYYWPNRPYNLLEVYEPTGELEEIYIHICSPVIVKGHELLYTDYELDVVQQPGEAAQIVDQDEFAEAIERYGYSPAMQAHCQQAAKEALDLAQAWVVNGWRK
jgi:GrpB-like predicted nucleotidyltransferase (UPF0157 family)/protein associated with RNAse G/E